MELSFSENKKGSPFCMLHFVDCCSVRDASCVVTCFNVSARCVFGVHVVRIVSDDEAHTDILLFHNLEPMV